jgi:uncharacterized protein YceK
LADPIFLSFLKMKKGSYVMRILTALLVLLLSGCATSVYKADALTPAKRYAVVSIIAAERIEGGSRPGMGLSLSGLVKAVGSKESGFTHSSAKILDESAPQVVKALASQNKFTVLPEKVTRANAGFKAATSDEQSRYNVAPGYKFFADDQKFGELARQMKVDGVIGVRLYYSAAESKFGIGGVFAVGKHSGITRMEVWAVDASGQRIWTDTFSETSKDSVGFVGDAVNFVTLHPLLVQSTDAVVVAMLDKLKKGY